MLAARTKLKDAQQVKKVLIQKDLLNSDFLPLKEFDYIYFPITKKVTIANAKVITSKIKFREKLRKKSIKEVLQNKLSLSEIKLIPKTQEIVGRIMILEIPEELQPKEKIIAQAYLQLNKHVETIVRKERMHEGVFRTRKVRILAGKLTKKTTHIESGVKIYLHLEKTYFSARSSGERLRIANLVKPQEEILVMFSGAGPFPLVIARHSAAKKIYGVELNTLAHYYAQENIILNGFTDKIVLYAGDVLNVVPNLKKNFDRVVMPLPKTSEEYLYLALPKVKKGGVIHLYAFFNEKDLVNEVKKVKKICLDLGFKVRVMKKVKCGQFSPGTFRWCFDIKVL
jgi:tRNA (guanine37-N1)-methyltransferase